jgi:hypothetical protein
MFRLFSNYVYTEKLATVNANMGPVVKSSRLVALCKLFAFAETLYMSNEFTNQIMDALQDDFLLAGMLPELGLMKAVYKAAIPESKLRTFCSHALIFGVRAGTFECYENVAEFLQENGDVFKDYNVAIKDFTPGQDPRIRDCERRPGCRECARAGVRGGVPSPGYQPCAFHVRKS